MFVARFEFLPEFAGNFCEDDQILCEMTFDNIVELVEFTKEFEECLREVLVYDGQQVISLREVSQQNS